MTVKITPGTHASEQQSMVFSTPFFSSAYSVSISFLMLLVNKQLNDKERVAAALENDSLLEIINKCLQPPKAC
jgi:hypothetical protein